MADKEIDIPIVGGLDEDTDARLTTKLVAANNCRYTKAGTLTVRDGQHCIGPYALYFGGVAMGTCQLLTTYREELVCVRNDLKLSSFCKINSTTDWISRGSTSPFCIERFDVTSGEISTDHDIAIAGDYSAMVSLQQSGSVYAVVLDVWNTTTQTFTFSSRVIVSQESDPTGEFVTIPKIRALSATQLIVTWAYYDGVSVETIRAVSVNLTTMAIGSPANLVTNAAAYDVMTLGGFLFVAYRKDSGANRTTIAKFNSSLTVTASFSVVEVFVASGNGIAIFGDTTTIHVAWSYATTGPNAYTVKTAGVTTALASVYTAATLYTQSGFAVAHTPEYLGGCVLSTTQAVVTWTERLAEEIDNTAFFTRQKRTARWGQLSRTNGGAVFSSARALDQFVFLSRPVYDVNLGGVFVYGTNNHSQACTGFVVHLPTGGNESTPTASLLAVTLPRQAIIAIRRNATSVSDMPSVGGSYYVAATFDAGPVRKGDAGATTVMSGGTALQLDPNRPVISSVENGNLLLLGGGVPSGYDSSRVFELGFPYEPDVAASLTAIAVSGNVTVGVHRYLCIYTWTDSAGNVHQSGPSPLTDRMMIDVTLPGYMVTLLLSPLRLTNKADYDSTANLVTIDVYRTLAGGASYYYVGTASNPTSGIGSIVFDDIVSDANIESNPQPYTLGISGEELANRILPSCRYVTAFKGSVVFSGSDDGTSYFSKPQVPGYGPGFNGSLTIDQFTAGERITALRAQDDILALWTPSRLFSVAGDPPLANGTSSISLPTQIPSAVGCSWAESLVTIPQGTMFLSDGDGYWLLSRGLSVSPIGKDVVDTYAGGSASGVSAAVLLGSQSIVRASHLGTTGNAVLDLRELNDSGQPTWTTETFYDAQLGTYVSPATVPPTINVQAAAATVSGATIWQGMYTWVSAAGYTYQEQIGDYADTNFANEAFPITVTGTLSWVKLAGLQGYTRCREIGVLFEADAAPPLGFTVGLDYGAVTPMTRAWTSAQVAAMTRQQIQIHPHPQKCEAFQVSFSTAGQTLATVDDVFKITGICCTVDINRGQMRIRPAQVK